MKRGLLTKILPISNTRDNMLFKRTSALRKKNTVKVKMSRTRGKHQVG